MTFRKIDGVDPRERIRKLIVTARIKGVTDPAKILRWVMGTSRGTVNPRMVKEMLEEEE